MTKQIQMIKSWYAVRRMVLMLPLVCSLGCLGDMNPGADGPAKPVKEPIKPATTAQPSPYTVPDFPDTTKSDASATPTTEKPVIELPADKPTEDKPTTKPEESKPAEPTPQTSSSTPGATTTEAKPPFKDDPFPNGEPVSKDEPKKEATREP